MPIPSDTFDLLTEVRDQVHDIRQVLLGNGMVGLCEQVRQNADGLVRLTVTVASLAQSVNVVCENQQVHREWHAVPENMTIQQAIAQPGIRFVALLLIGIFIVIGAAVGIVDAVGFLKALL